MVYRLFTFVLVLVMGCQGLLLATLSQQGNSVDFQSKQTPYQIIREDISVMNRWLMQKAGFNKSGSKIENAQAKKAFYRTGMPPLLILAIAAALLKIKSLDYFTNKKEVSLIGARLAALDGNLESIREFVKQNKPSLNKVQTVMGNTVLHSAVEGGNSQAVLYLIAQGAALEVKDTKGLTPLMIAVNGYKTPVERGKKDLSLEFNDRQERKNVIKLLLECGANIHAMNNQGQTVIDLAALTNDAEIISMIQNASRINEES